MDIDPYIHSAYQMVMSLNWFISMSVMNAFHPVMGAAILLPILIALIPYAVIGKGDKAAGKEKTAIISSLMIMPAYWVVIGLWGGAFARRQIREGENLVFLHYPDYINYVVLMFFAAFFIYAGYRVYKNKGHRVFSTFYASINLYFVLSVTFIAGMSMSGAWL